MDASELLAGIRLLPVVVIESVEQAPGLARALHNAGIGAIEVTLRSHAAMAAIAAIAREVPEIIVGAGSVREPEQFAAIRAAGAAFAVSPGSTEALIATANLPWIPGAATASECLRLLECGYSFQKFFPAEQSGGAAALRALSAPLPEVRFCPTGGISPVTVSDYTALPCVSCIGGSWFVPADRINAADFNTITTLAEAALQLVAQP